MSRENLIPPQDQGHDESVENGPLIGSHSLPSEGGSEQGEANGRMFGRDKTYSRLSPMRSLSCCSIIALLASVLLIILSIAMLAGGYHATINWFVRKQLVISNGTEAYDMWRVTPIPLLLKLYLFNLTNPEEVKQGYKPIIEECGPYVWRELHEKQNISFHANNTVTYYQQRWWVWDQEESGNHTQNDTIVTINVIPVSVAWSMRDAGRVEKIGVDLAFVSLEEQAIITTTAGKMLFDGVQDPMLDWVQKEVVPVNSTFHWALKYFGKGGGLASYDKFAWFYKRNMSLEYDGLFNMKTGADNISNLGVIDWWNKEHSTSFYGSPCNSIKGSTGELFPPNVAKDNITFFNPDLCMSTTLFYKEAVSSDGIAGYRFWGSNHTFANSSVVPGNECFCVSGVCAPTGLLNAESCRMGAPAFLSFPHFFNADPFLLDGVSGLSPNETLHQFAMDIIPELGVPMKVTPRIQINLRIRPDRSYGILRNLPDVYLPMLWFEILGEMTPNLAYRTRMVTYLLHSPIVALVIWVVLMVIAAGVAVSTIVWHYQRGGSGDV